MLLSPIAIFLSNKIILKMAATVFSEHRQHKHNKQLSPASKNTAALQAIKINKWISRVKARFFLFSRCGVDELTGSPGRLFVGLLLVAQNSLKNVSGILKMVVWRTCSVLSVCIWRGSRETNFTWNDLFCRSRLPTVDSLSPPMFTMSFYINQCHLKLP